MIILDTSGLFAALVPDQPQHDAVVEALTGEDPPLVLSPFVLAELDYLLATRGGVRQELELLGEVARGTYELASFDSEDVARAAVTIEQYRDLGIGLADASIVALAQSRGTQNVLTLDERHFRALRMPDGRPFRLVPADA